MFLPFLSSFFPSLQRSCATPATGEPWSSPTSMTCQFLCSTTSAPTAWMLSNQSWSKPLFPKFPGDCNHQNRSLHFLKLFFSNALLRIPRSKSSAYYQGTGYSMALVKGPDKIKRRVFKFHTNSRETNALLFYIGNEVGDSFSWQNQLFALADGDCYHKVNCCNLYSFLFCSIPFPGVFFLCIFGEELSCSAGKGSRSRVQTV